MSDNRALRASLAALRSTQLEHMGPATTRPIAERVARMHASILEAIAARDATWRASGCRPRTQRRSVTLTLRGRSRRV